MSNRNCKGKSPKPELKLSVLPRGEPSTLMRMVADDEDYDNDIFPNRNSTSSSVRSLTSPPSSCVSSENSPEASKSMVLAGCPRCLMYVMLSEDEELKCPKCNNAVLLNFNHQKNKRMESAKDSILPL